MTNNRRHEERGPADAWEAAARFGIDVHQLDDLLSLTPAERFRRHALALERVRAMRQAGIAYYGFDPRAPEALDRSEG